MTVIDISLNDLRRMEGQEGLILQGCGGNPAEWVAGLNEMLTKVGVLRNGSQFEKAFRFQNKGRTCLLFPFEKGIKLDIGKLSMWRLVTHEDFGGTWLSDYVPNHLGGFLPQKPDCPLIGEDGNVFNLVGLACRTLKAAGQADQAREMSERVFRSDSYDQALNIIGEYVNITSVNEAQEQAWEEPSPGMTLG